MLLQPGDPLVRHVFGEVILLIVRRLDGGGVLHEARLPLRGFTGQEAVEVLEAVACGPIGERPHRRGLVGGRVVPFAEGGGLVAVVFQNLGHRRGSLRHDAGVAVPIHRTLGDGAAADALVIAPGEQRRAGGRTDRGGVEAVVADAFVAELRKRRRVRETAEGVRHAEAGVVDQHDEHVRRTLRQTIRLDATFVDRIPASVGPALLAEGARRKWQHRAVVGRGGERRRR